MLSMLVAISLFLETVGLTMRVGAQAKTRVAEEQETAERSQANATTQEVCGYLRRRQPLSRVRIPIITGRSRGGAKHRIDQGQRVWLQTEENSWGTRCARGRPRRTAKQKRGAGWCQSPRKRGLSLRRRYRRARAISGLLVGPDLRCAPRNLVLPGKFDAAALRGEFGRPVGGGLPQG